MMETRAPEKTKCNLLHVIYMCNLHVKNPRPKQAGVKKSKDVKKGAGLRGVIYIDLGLLFTRPWPTKRWKPLTALRTADASQESIDDGEWSELDF
jgi:hypothetical protein